MPGATIGAASERWAAARRCLIRNPQPAWPFTSGGELEIRRKVMGTSQPDFIVGIGGSAGGLVAYKALLEALPSDTGMAFVIVSHLMPTATSELAQILRRHTKMSVSVAVTATRILANHVYVIPPDADLRIESETFHVVSPRVARNVQIDVFLRSLAEALGARAIGIILSGYGGDGTEGCRQIKAKGGRTFAQDMSAQAEDLSLSAQASGCVDLVLPPDKIAMELQRLVSARRDRRARQ